jgi:hypothetical protein
LNDPSGVLRKAAQILRKRGWTKSYLIRSDETVCLIGAIALAEGRLIQRDEHGTAYDNESLYQDMENDPAVITLSEVLRGRGRANSSFNKPRTSRIYSFNDDSESVDEIIQLLEEASVKAGE